MKKILSIILMGFTLISFAQMGHGHKQKENQFTPEQQATIKTKNMVLQFDLNESQQNQLLSLNKKRFADREKAMAIHKSMKESGKMPDQDQRFEMKNKMLDAQIAYQSSIKKILNKEQFEKWRSMAKSKYKMKKKHMSGKKMHVDHRKQGVREKS